MGEENYRKGLTKWVNTLTIEEKLALKVYHLDMLLSLKQICVDYNFLRASCSF